MHITSLELDTFKRFIALSKEKDHKFYLFQKSFEMSNVWHSSK